MNDKAIAIQYAALVNQIRGIINEGKIDEAEAMLKENIALHESYSDKNKNQFKLLSSLNNQYSQIYREKGDFENALHYINKAMDSIESSKYIDPIYINLLYEDKANILEEISGRIAECIECYEESLEIKKALVEAYFESLADSEDDSYLLPKSSQFAIDLMLNSRISIMINHLAELYNSIEDYNKAWDCYEESVDWADKEGNLFVLIKHIHDYHFFLNIQGEYDLAQELLEKKIDKFVEEADKLKSDGINNYIEYLWDKKYLIEYNKKKTVPVDIAFLRTKLIHQRFLQGEHIDFHAELPALFSGEIVEIKNELLDSFKILQMLGFSTFALGLDSTNTYVLLKAKDYLQICLSILEKDPIKNEEYTNQIHTTLETIDETLKKADKE